MRVLNILRQNIITILLIISYDFLSIGKVRDLINELDSDSSSSYGSKRAGVIKYFKPLFGL